MKKNMLIAAVTLAILGGGIVAYYFWQNSQPEAEVAVAEPPPPLPPAPAPAPAPAPEVSQAMEPVPATPPLPNLADSDSYLLDALAGLVGNPSLMKLFNNERMIRNIVATVDNLPRTKLPLRLMPVRPVSGKFITRGSEDTLTISPRNAERYSPYMKIAEAIDASKLVGLYVRLYPLFQQAYHELGYPDNDFNERLLEVLDDLLDAPDISDPVRLVRPNVMFLFADPDLEALSIGQRILIRIGGKNAAEAKAWLGKVRQALQAQGPDHFHAINK